jgi:hypothetical protein
VKSIHLSHDRDNWQPVVNTVSIKGGRGMCWLAERLLASQEGLCSVVLFRWAWRHSKYGYNFYAPGMLVFTPFRRCRWFLSLFIKAISCVCVCVCLSWFTAHWTVCVKWKMLFLRKNLIFLAILVFSVLSVGTVHSRKTMNPILAFILSELIRQCTVRLKSSGLW